MYSKFKIKFKINKIKMEIKINAAQHIYGNVEADKSPRKKRGFQTLFYTQNKISEEELAEIEKRMIYYFDKGNPVKHLFFPLKDKVVVSRIIPRPETDKFGRYGIYFAHSLVFDNEDFKKINANPFILFRKFKFMESPDEATHSKGDFKTGNIGETEEVKVNDDDLKEIESSMIKEMEKWKNEARNLTYIACNPKILAANKNFLKVEAEQKETEKFLMAIFSVIPSEYRLNISFDTYFYNCDPVRNYFNIIGILPKQSFLFTNYIPVNINERTLKYDAPERDDSLYYRWVNQSIDRLDWEGILKRRENACAFENFINDWKYEEKLLSELSDDFISDLVNFKRDLWRSKVRNEIGKHFGKTIADRTASVILNTLNYKNLLVSMLTGFDKDIMAKILYEKLLDDLDRISQSEIREIEKFPKLTRPLLVIISFIKEDNKFKENLNALAEEDYEKFVHAVLLKKPGRMLELLLPNKQNSFIETLVKLSKESGQIEENIRSTINPEVRSKIENKFDEKIAEICADKISKEYEIERLVNFVVNGFDENEIAEVLYDAILEDIGDENEFAKVLGGAILEDIGKDKSSAFKAVKSFSNKFHDEGLSAAVSFIKKDKKFHEHFDKLDLEKYKKFLRAVVMNKPRRIEELMSSRMERFMDVAIELLKESDEKEDTNDLKEGFFRIIIALINKEEWENLEMLEPHIDKFHFSRGQLKDIRNFLKKKKGGSDGAKKLSKKLDELLESADDDSIFSKIRPSKWF